MQNLNEILNILSQFQAELEFQQKFFQTTHSRNPNFSPVSEANCRKELARCWIYGCDNIGTLLNVPLPKIPYHPEASQSQASKHYISWQNTIEKNAEPNSLYSEYFLNHEEFGDYHLEEPKNGETLHDYILRLQDVVENKENIHFLWERGLSSFLHYLRQTIPDEQIAFLELIFPEEMEIRKITSFKPKQTGKSTWELQEVPFGQIVRKTPPNKYPIFILTAADIMRELANTVLHGKQNAKLTAAESLGLCWDA